MKQINQATSPQSDQPSPVHVQPPQSTTTTSAAGRSTTKNEKRSANTLYQELSFQDNEESEENEVTGKFKQTFWGKKYIQTENCTKKKDNHTPIKIKPPKKLIKLKIEK